MQLYLELSQLHCECCAHTHFNFVGYTAYAVGVSGLSVALADVASLDYSLLMSVFY